MIEILDEEYHVEGKLATPININLMLRTKAVFLNWVETSGLNRSRKLQILLYKLFGARIIWVFHNKYPHDTILNKVSTRNINWLARHSNIIMLHSKSSSKYIPDAARNRKKAVYVPHILYGGGKGKPCPFDMREKYKISDEDFVFTIFGTIRPYKKIERGIEAFQKLQMNHAKLIIAGSPEDAEYVKDIERLCEGSKNIILDMHYLSAVKLDGIIDISDVVLLPYQNKSSMNSGVMIQAFSRGKTVIIPNICMARDLAQYHFFYMYQKHLDQVMLKAYENGKDINRHMGEQAKEYIYEHNNKEVVKKYVYRMLSRI